MITGGTGFIGYHTALELVENGHEVRLLVRNPDKAAGLYGESTPDCVKGDIAGEAEKAVLTGAVDGLDAASADLRGESGRGAAEHARIDDGPVDSERAQLAANGFDLGQFGHQ